MLSKKYLLFLIGAAAGVSILFILASNPNARGYAPSHQPIPVVDSDGDYNFAGEALPVEQFDVAERLERELLVNAFYHSSTILAIKMANRYFPTIEKILKEEGVPEDLKYLAVAESGLRPATSSADAKGVWQFMKESAIQYGLEVNEEVDERYHLEKSTRAACTYFKSLKNRFGTWTLAAAAYNMGGASLARTMEEQRAANFFELNINDETSRYIFRVVAMKDILQDPESYGFTIPKDQLYKPLDDYMLVEVDGAVPSWGEFAKSHQTNYRVLKVYNPWLRDFKLANKGGKTYQVMIPR